jgi:uncharacterized membrane protein
MASIFAIIDPSINISPSGASVEWYWTDWLGLIALLIAIAFVLTVIVALLKGAEPLKVLRQVSGMLSVVYRRKSN